MMIIILKNNSDKSINNDDNNIKYLILVNVFSGHAWMYLS